MNLSFTSILNSTRHINFAVMLIFIENKFSYKIQSNVEEIYFTINAERHLSTVKDCLKF